MVLFVRHLAFGVDYLSLITIKGRSGVIQTHLESDDAPVLSVPCLIHNTVSAFTKVTPAILLNLLVPAAQFG